MSEHWPRRTTLLLVAELVCVVVMFLPTWSTSSLPEGGTQRIIHLGLPFSPWVIGRQTWTSAGVEGATDFAGELRLDLWSWSMLVALLGTVLGLFRRKRPDRSASSPG